MEFTVKQRTFQSICSDIGNGAIDFDSYLQRQVGQWSPIQKSKLIDSILRGYPIPPIYGVKGDKALSIIDGCQRASTVYSFKKDGFNLSSTLKSIEYEEKDDKGKVSKVTFDLAKKSYKQLPAVLQKKIDDFEITVTTLTNPTNQEIIDCFDRLNGGTPLSKPQKNKVYMSYELAQDIANIAKGDVFKLTGLSKTQVKRDEPQMVVAQSLMLLDPNYTVNGFSATQVQKYLADFSTRYDKTLLSKLADIFDSLATIIPTEQDLAFSQKNFKKVMIPCVVKAMENIYDEKIDLKTFRDKFVKFLASASVPDNYTKYATLHTTSKENIEGRVAFFEKMAK